MNSLNKQETKELVAKLKQIEFDISQERGSFTLYAMFIRKSGVGWWDIVMAADWLTDATRTAFGRYIADLWRSRLTGKEMTNIGITIIDQYEKEGLEEALEELKPVEHGEEKVKDFYILGQEIEKGIVITARPKTVAA